MPFIAEDPYLFLGEKVDNGQCMRHVQIVANVTHSSTLRRGDWVRSATAPYGTIIATFDPDGTYGNHTDGSSHIAILVSRDNEGLRVVDQWSGQPVHERLIRYKNGSGPACDDGDQFYVVETAGLQEALAV